MQQDHAMMIRADARAIGAVTSTTTRVSDRWKSTGSHRASECISYYAADKSDATIFRAARTESTPRTRALSDIDIQNKHDDAHAHDIFAGMLAPIGNVE